MWFEFITSCLPIVLMKIIAATKTKKLDELDRKDIILYKIPHNLESNFDITSIH